MSLPDHYGDNPWSANVAASGGGLGALLARLFGGGQSASAPSGLGIAPAPLPPPRPTEFGGSPNSLTVTPAAPSSGMPSEGLLSPPSYQPGAHSSLPTMAQTGTMGLTGIGRTPSGVPSMLPRKGQLLPLDATPTPTANNWAPSPSLWSGR